MFKSFESRNSFLTRSGGGFWLCTRRPFLGLHQASVGAIAVGMIFGSPTAADGDRRRLVEFQNMRLNVRPFMGAVAERRILRARAAAIRHAFRYLVDNRRFDKIVVRQGHL